MKTTAGILAVIFTLGCAPEPLRLGSVSIDDDFGRTVLFRDTAVFDGEGMLQHQDVLIEGEWIAAVGATGTLGIHRAAVEISGAGRTLLPGLVDSHAHLVSAGERRGRPPGAEEIAEAFLFGGVTTILVAAGGPEIPKLVESSAAGEALTPHLYTAGHGLTAPGGHPIPLLRAMLAWPMSWIVIRSIPVAEDAEQAAARVREVVDAWAPDLFKIIYDDLPPGSPHLSRGALDGAIQAAKHFGLRAVVHASASRDAVVAAQRGAAMLMHVPQKDVLSDEQVNQLLAAGIPVVTTVRLIAASRELAREGPVPIESATIDPRILQAWIDDPRWGLAGFSEQIDGDNDRIAQYTMTNFRKLLAAGVPLFVGTDSGVHGIFPGSGIHREISKLVELGMPPIQVLRAATSAPADFLDPEARFGRIAPGQRADLLLVRGDPSADIEALSEIEEIFLSGTRLIRSSVGDLKP